jgi:Calcineurin-like phosphoesterase
MNRIAPTDGLNRPGIPLDVPLRIVGDVHGDAKAFAYAVATDRFVVQLGDLVDYGPDSATTLELMFDLIDRGRGLFLIGNHDFKLARALSGQHVYMTPILAETLRMLGPELRSRALTEFLRAPAWLRHDGALFVHGGFHPAMLVAEAPPIDLRRPDGPLSRALYGEPTGRTQQDGFPERSLGWVDRIPAGMTVYCGHDRRSTDGRPYRRSGIGGGTAVFLDTGASKGGHLSWIDLPPVIAPTP